MKEKVIAWGIALCLVLGAVPVTPASAANTPPTATGTVANRISQLKSTFPVGSFFTVNGQSCTHDYNSTCSNCNMTNIMKSMGYSGAMGMVDSWTCLSFARFAFYYIFGAKQISNTVT